MQYQIQLHITVDCMHCTAAFLRLVIVTSEMGIRHKNHIELPLQWLYKLEAHVDQKSVYVYNIIVNLIKSNIL